MKKGVLRFFRETLLGKAPFKFFKEIPDYGMDGLHFFGRSRQVAFCCLGTCDLFSFRKLEQQKRFFRHFHYTTYDAQQMN